MNEPGSPETRVWHSSVGDLQLCLPQLLDNGNLQAWDAADEWLIDVIASTGKEHYVKGHSLWQINASGQHFSAHGTSVLFSSAHRRLTIIGDDYGVLASSLILRLGREVFNSVTFIHDSFLSLEAARKNIALNSAADTGKGGDMVQFIPASSLLDAAPLLENGDSDVLLRIPKGTELFSLYFRAALRLAGRTGTVWVGGMSSRWTPPIKQETSAHSKNALVGRFVKKARWIGIFPGSAGSSEFEASEASEASANGQATGREYKTFSVESSRRYLGLPGVFSASKLDRGSRLLLSVLLHRAGLEDRLPAGSRIGDLGCGSGVLGIELIKSIPGLSLQASDDSSLAIESTKINAKNHGVDQLTETHWTHGFIPVEKDSLDLVICNPPFHHGKFQTIDVALAMFAEAFRCLKKGRALFVVANAHLGYHSHMKRWFSGVEILHQDTSFYVLKGTK